MSGSRVDVLGGEALVGLEDDVGAVAGGSRKTALQAPGCGQTPDGLARLVEAVPRLRR